MGKEYLAKCVLCDYKTKSSGMKVGKLRWKDGCLVVNERLHHHVLEEHPEIIAEVWVNSHIELYENGVCIANENG